MSSTRFFVIPLFFLLLIGNYTVAGQGEGKSSKPLKGFRAEYLTQLDEVEKKYLDLAEAFPAEKFGWRPGEGVRSVSEVLVHIGSANYLYPQFIGIKPSTTVSQDMEKTVTEKGKVVGFVRQSFIHLRKAVLSVSDTDLNSSAKFLGQSTTKRGILFNAANHLHEHLGQLIAYARVNGIVPPWSAVKSER